MNSLLAKKADKTSLKECLCFLLVRMYIKKNITQMNKANSLVENISKIFSINLSWVINVDKCFLHFALKCTHLN